ncbi:MAG: hypothetical protein OXL96_09670 [Candidatus Poribacteria bacterium]|nr:hypothetical protein [Candidatus Poribacteria bacterium]
MDTHQATRWTQFITPLGGIVALICFFFPWVTTVENFKSGLSYWRVGLLHYLAYSCPGRG